MVEVKPTYDISARICVAILWRSLVMGIPVIFLVGLFTAGAFQALGNGGANVVAWFAVFIAAVLIQSFCIQLVIGQVFGRARLVLVADPQDTNA